LKTLTPEKQVSESGLRSYSPALGRWTARDPILDETFRIWSAAEQVFGSEEKHLAYCVVQNNPANYRDPLGLAKQEGCSWSTVIKEIRGKKVKCRTCNKGDHCKYIKGDKHIPGTCGYAWRDGSGGILFGHPAFGVKECCCLLGTYCKGKTCKLKLINKGKYMWCPKKCRFLAICVGETWLRSLDYDEAPLACCADSKDKCENERCGVWK